MTTRLQHHLERWVGAGLIDAPTADRIRAYEAQHERAGGLRWPVLLAVGLGGLLLGAGVLLFVAAHWETLSPAFRFSLVVSLVALFHAAGALSIDRFPPLASALHAVGTVCLGAGIYLAAQIFNLQEHWPSGVLLWAIGACVAWALLRDWPQAALAALLVPAWLGAEWMEATRISRGGEKILWEGLLLLAICYLSARVPGRDTAIRRALAWIGGLAIIPFAALVALEPSGSASQRSLPPGYAAMGWAMALLLPMLLASWLRRKAAWINGLALLWVVALGATGRRWQPPGSAGVDWESLATYALCALGSVGLIAWGMRESRRERVNLGVAGFALTVLAFYFSTVMDKLGRSASLFGLGLLFLLGGWLIERTRRRLLAQLAEDR